MITRIVIKPADITAAYPNFTHAPITECKVILTDSEEDQLLERFKERLKGESNGNEQ